MGLKVDSICSSEEEKKAWAKRAASNPWPAAPELPRYNRVFMNGKYLSAEDARSISGPNTDEWVMRALGYIRAFAEEKQREVLLNRKLILDKDADFWVLAGYHQHPDWLAVKKVLEDLGYHVSYEFKDQPSAGTLIRW